MRSHHRQSLAIPLTCTCGVCPDCREAMALPLMRRKVCCGKGNFCTCGRWEEIYSLKFQDHNYYGLRPAGMQSSLGGNTFPMTDHMSDRRRGNAYEN